MATSVQSTSERLFERAKRVLPAGVSRNTLLYDGALRYVSHGKGCRVWDVDGTEYIDFANNMAAHIHGHSFKPIVDAVGEQLKLGTAFTMATEVEVQFAEHMVWRSPSFDKIRFVNSGTEAVMAAMKAARAFTGRAKIAKIEGSYHGTYDYAEVSQASAPENWGDHNRPAAVSLARGTPVGVVDDVLILPFNDEQSALAVLDAHRSDVAGVVLDPVPHRVSMVPAEASFVSALKAWTRRNGAVLIFDEVITFRNEVGGMQSRYYAQPDLTALGKMIGGGFPVGALAGRAEIMDVFQSGDKGLRLPLAGTFSANPITMTAGLVAMSHFDAEAVARLNDLGDKARVGLREAIKTADVPASVTGTGSLLRIHFKAQPPRNYREAYASPIEKQALSAMIAALYDQGIVMIHTGSAALSTAMGEAEIDRLVAAAHAAFGTIKPILEKLK